MADEEIETTEETVDDNQDADNGLLANASEKEPNPVEEAAVKPEYLPEKFWDKETNAPNIEALAKSQADFEKKARAKVGEVPTDSSEYSLELPEELAEKVDIPDDDPMISSAKDIAFKHGMSKEAFNGFMGEMISVIAENQQETIDSSDEMAKLGDRGETIVQGVADWLDKAEANGLLSENEREALNTQGSSADGIKALNKIRMHYTRDSTIPNNVSTEDGAMSSEEYYNAVGSERYTTDIDYRNKVKEQGRRIFGTEPAGSSKAGLGVR